MTVCYCNMFAGLWFLQPPSNVGIAASVFGAGQGLAYAKTPWGYSSSFLRLTV